ncbi:MAG: hypothetical protein M3512_06475 [Bacteroidota bacterium]|nr:hypothetical protein [Bacteroidota bacterium]
MLYKPKDVVSGAFMTISGHYLLKKAVNVQNCIIAPEILNSLNQGIVEELTQHDANSLVMDIMDIMDIALCVIDKDKIRRSAGR